VFTACYGMVLFEILKFIFIFDLIKKYGAFQIFNCGSFFGPVCPGPIMFKNNILAKGAKNIDLALYFSYLQNTFLD
jgi:hypothetical protein